MKKNKYKDYNEKNYKKILIVLFVMIFILMLIAGILEKIQKDNEAKTEIGYEQISTIKEIIEYHKSKYISENESTDTKFKLDVYVEFGKLLYDENNKSNETYYNELLKDCAKILRYKSFKLIDNKNDIIIKVICNGEKITSIIINDIEDYFIYTDSQLSLKQYKEIESIDISVESEILQNCINSDWNKDIYFGERDSIFDNYYIFFDEGIKVRFIDGKIYNIVFTKQYGKNVVNNCFPGIDFDYIKTTLGEPSFKNEEETLIGYKGKQFYTFFTENEISIYRNTEVDSDDFFDLSDKFLSDEMDLLEFMNELTYVWPDYGTYEYASDYVYISYPLKGIEIAINYGDINGILVYNNNKSSLSKIARYLENTNFVGRLQTDLVFKSEEERIIKDSDWINKCKEFENSLSEEEMKSIGESLKYAIYPEFDNNGYIYKIKFISKFGKQPNRELNDGLKSYLWLTDDYFLFSKEGIGIYFYNLNTGRVQKILEGKDEYKLKEYRNGILKYDDKEIQLQF